MSQQRRLILGSLLLAIGSAAGTLSSCANKGSGLNSLFVGASLTAQTAAKLEDTMVRIESSEASASRRGTKVGTGFFFIKRNIIMTRAHNLDVTGSRRQTRSIADNTSWQPDTPYTSPGIPTSTSPPV